MTKDKKRQINLFDRIKVKIDCISTFVNEATNELEPYDISHVKGIWPKSSDHILIYAACDAIYFESYAELVAKSVAESNPEAGLHIHVYEPPDELQSYKSLIDKYNNITITWDSKNLCPYETHRKSIFYYTSARFIRLYQIALMHPHMTIASVDMDSVFRKSIAAFLPDEGRYDIGVFARPRSRKVAKRILASIFVVFPTEDARRALGTMAVALAKAMERKPDHNIDQLVIYYILQLTRIFRRPLNVWHVPKSLTDWEFSPESAIWSAKGSSRKAEFLGRIEAENAPTPSPPHSP